MYEVGCLTIIVDDGDCPSGCWWVKIDTRVNCLESNVEQLVSFTDDVIEDGNLPAHSLALLSRIEDDRCIDSTIVSRTYIPK